MTDQPHDPPPLSGIVLVDKPYRLSSMSIVRVVKRRLINSGLPKSIKVGHGGTLDPLASGLMVILVGKATKHCDRIMAGRKR
ncbi:MAG: tRNA pseudouridine(55) synthase TruB, partial [Phycisphaerales bacterium]